MSSVGLEGLQNNVNSYKGVMLCTRPNENIVSTKQKPFISRVDPKENLGINPVKKVQIHEVAKKPNPVLQRHRAWLENFKRYMREKKINEEMKNIQEKEKFERIKEIASSQRVISQDANKELQKLEDLSNGQSPEKKSPKDNSNQGSSEESPKKQEQEKQSKTTGKKKENKEKPKWAYTEEQVKQEEDIEVDELLEFTNKLDYDKYINDLEVKHMIFALKKRIDELRKEEDDWKNKVVDAWNNESKEDKRSVKPSKVDLNYDTRSDARSVASEAKSAASEKSQKSISELKVKLEQKEKKDWDSLSTISKKNAVTIEERIAKHVADEILRNNTEFRHFHSNASVRKILEKEAQKHMEEPLRVKGPEIIANKEYHLLKGTTDPNNLPYLHRNPAV